MKAIPSQIEIRKDVYKKHRVYFTDSDGAKYNKLPITEKKFNDIIENFLIKAQRFTPPNKNNINKRMSLLEKLNYISQLPKNQYIGKNNQFIKVQKKVYLRVGLGREFEATTTGEIGYWLQINGIYTFPDSLQENIESILDSLFISEKNE